MSELTLPQLMAVAPAVLHDAAQAWAQFAKDIEAAAEDYMKGTRPLHDAWAGTAADDAQPTVWNLRRDLDAAYLPARQISVALTASAEHFGLLRQQAFTLIEQAEESGYSFDRTTYDITAPSDSELAARRRSEQATMTREHLLTRLSDLLIRARQTDDETARIISANTPGADGKLGTRVVAPAVTAADLEAQKKRTPQQVRDWWDTLTPQQRQEAILGYPGLVGWLDGVPAVARDQANRLYLHNEQGRLKAEQADLRAQRAVLQQAADSGKYGHGASPEYMALKEQIMALDHRIEADDKYLGVLDGVDTQLKTGTDGIPRYLLGVDPYKGASGRLLVAVGNPDTAANVVTYVPGLSSNINDPKDMVDRADSMAKDAAYLSGKPSAAILWLGYEAPQLTNLDVAHNTDALNARGDLNRFQDGLRASHDGPPAHDTVIGHSYGSTVVGYTAAADNGINADDVIFVGSPGTGVDNVTGLHLRDSAGNVLDSRQHVWASTAAHDIIQATGTGAALLAGGAALPVLAPVLDAAAGAVGTSELRFGHNPADPGYGARVFHSDDGSWNPAAAHSQYWDDRSASRVNIAQIVAGQPEKVK